MEKDRIMKQKQDLIPWTISLKSLSNEQWFLPFQEGMWGTADVISHFISWDKFMIENRMIPLIKNKAFPKVNIDVEKINEEASNYARAGILKEELIDQFVTVRADLVSLLGEIPKEKFDQPCPGKEHITLSAYFDGMITHDLKHKEQIDHHIKSL